MIVAVKCNLNVKVKYKKSKQQSSTFCRNIIKSKLKGFIHTYSTACTLVYAYGQQKQSIFNNLLFHVMWVCLNGVVCFVYGEQCDVIYYLGT